MSVKQFAAQFKTLIEDLKSKGTAAIYCDNLIAYLNEVQNSPDPEPSPVEIERFKADLQNWVEANKHQQDQQLEMFRSVISSGQSAIKASLILNGGAAVALLAFISHLAASRPERVSVFAPSIVPFAFGALAIVVTAGLTYITQWLYARPKTIKLGFAANIGCILLGIISYGSFVWGLYRTYALLTTFVS